MQNGHTKELFDVIKNCSFVCACVIKKFQQESGHFDEVFSFYKKI